MLVSENTLNKTDETLNSHINLALTINDPNVIKYLAQFDEETRMAKAAEALKVGS